MLFALSLVSAAAAVGPAALTIANLREYREPPLLGETEQADVTVIVPARNEAAGIAECVDSVLRSRDVSLRIVVVNDGSTDATADIVRELARRDERLLLLEADLLRTGWNGKQHACWQGAQAATTSIVCFLDADVRLQPAALARMATLLRHGDGRQGASAQIGLVSGFPLEQTGTALERLLLPLIHFVLLGLLPMRFLRTTTNPGFSAGCGQFLMVDRGAYMSAGGHAAIRETMHDGIRLPRLMREHGYATRLADLTALATCRMYRSGAETWNGLAKNATEGLGAPKTIVPATLILGVGQVLPLPLLAVAVARLVYRRNSGTESIAGDVICVALAATAVCLSYLPRVLAVPRYRQSRLSAALHPVGVATLLALQWFALGRKLVGRPATWKSRVYQAN